MMSKKVKTVLAYIGAGTFVLAAIGIAIHAMISIPFESLIKLTLAVSVILGGISGLRYLSENVW
jgi:hypothetical protein